jgi:hypothetical protein
MVKEVLLSIPGIWAEIFPAKFGELSWTNLTFFRKILFS